MNWALVIPLLLPLFQTLSNIYSASTGGGLAKIATAFEGAASTLTTELTSIGSVLFPSLSPTLHAAAAALLAAESQKISGGVATTAAVGWVQAALNLVEKAGLVVDGIYGPKTQAAILAFQKSLGIPATGTIDNAEIAALQAVLAKS